MGQRVTYRRKNGYNTASNKIRKIRTPGGRLVAQHKGKKVQASRKLGGVQIVRSSELAHATRTQKSVNRAYGGEITHNDLRDRILRAFMIDEVKIIKQVVAQGQKKDKKSKSKKQ